MEGLLILIGIWVLDIVIKKVAANRREQQQRHYQEQQSSYSRNTSSSTSSAKNRSNSKSKGKGEKKGGFFGNLAKKVVNKFILNDDYLIEGDSFVDAPDGSEENDDESSFVDAPDGSEENDDESSFVDAPDGPYKNDQLLVVNNNVNLNSFTDESSFVDAPEEIKIDSLNSFIDKNSFVDAPDGSEIIDNNKQSIVSYESSFIDAPDTLNENQIQSQLKSKLNEKSISYISDPVSFVDTNEVSELIEPNEEKSHIRFSLNINTRNNDVNESMNDLANKSSADAFDITTPISPIYGRSSIIELENISEDCSIRDDQIDTNENNKLNRKILDDKIKSDLEMINEE